MCGFSVIINKDKGSVDAQLLQLMNNRIIHRGPDDSGVFINENIGFGHRRLAILDLSGAGKQPMIYQDNVIVYNGEIYNYIELKTELIEQGYSFITQTDTEVILAAYDFWGKDCLKHFNGMWAFALYDKKRNVVFCSRDRFGIKPFCYTVFNDSLHLASEAKQFLDLPGFKAEIERDSVYTYLVDNNLNTGEKTFLKGVFHLKSGHNLEYDLKKNTFCIEQWYDLNKIKSMSNADIDFNTAASTFVELLEQSVKLRLRSDVKLGSCLSGGLDSSSIVCFASELNGKLHTVTSCYLQKEFDEQYFADLVIKKTNSQPHKVFPDLDDLINNSLMEKICYHQDQPVLSASHFSEYKVFETAAKNKLIVMLDGQGADEYLAGYGEFFMFYWKDLLRKGNIKKLYKEIKSKSLLQNQSSISSMRSFANFLFLGNLKNKVLKVNEDSNNIYNRDFLKDHAHIKSVYPDNLNSIKNIKDLSIHELLFYSLPYQLHSEDRSSMMHSVESRIPFLDHNLLEFVLSLPDDYKIRNGMTKALIREGMKEILPREIIDRHKKMGFVAPDNLWMENNPAAIKNELLQAVDNLKGIINNKIIIDFENFIAGKKPYSNIFFKVICLNHWMRSFDISIE